MKKRILALSIIVIMAFSLIACGTTANTSSLNSKTEKVFAYSGREATVSSLEQVMDLYYSQNTMTDQQKWQFEQQYKLTDEYWLIHEFEKDKNAGKDLTINWKDSPMYKKHIKELNEATSREQEEMTYETIDPIKKQEYQRLSKEIANKVNTYLGITEMNSLDFTKPYNNVVFVVEELIDNPDNYENVHETYDWLLEQTNLSKYFLEKTTPDNSAYYKRQVYKSEIIVVYLGSELSTKHDKTILDVYNEIKKDYPNKNIFVNDMASYIYNGEGRGNEKADTVNSFAMNGSIV